MGEAGRIAAVTAMAAMLVAVGGFAIGCGAGEETAGGQSERVKFTYARALFREICAGCHRLADAGADGNREALDDSNLSETSQKHQLARFVIEYGDSIMPGWKGSLTRKETTALVDYLATVTGASTRSADGKRASVLTSRSRPYERDPPSTREESLAEGKSLFKEMCAGCHALADADAHGTRVDLDAALAPIPNRAAVIRRALRESPAMPDWTIRLTETEIDSLVLYLSTVAGRGL